MNPRDPRLTPARRDLAADHLRGEVAAERYVAGRDCQVSAAVLDLKRAPRADAALDTQLLCGELVRLYDEEDGWAWVQAERDGYVGYVASRGLSETVVAPTHQVVVARTFVYPAPDMKRPVLAALPLAARIAVAAADGGFVRRHDGGFLYARHLAPLAEVPCADPASTAAALLGTPYLWGGRTPQGIDCSGLIQLAFAMAGVALPRDTHMQEALGRALPEYGRGARRGDLVFWPGHVGILTDAETLLHANAHHMLVRAEPLRRARDRIAPVASISSIRRLL